MGAPTNFKGGIAEDGVRTKRGVASVTGTLDVVTGLTSITGATVSMGAAPGTGAGNRFLASYSKSGGTLTLNVWQDDVTASSQATEVSWTAWGT